MTSDGQVPHGLQIDPVGSNHERSQLHKAALHGTKFSHQATLP